jgi:hypothetical protein
MHSLKRGVQPQSHSTANYDSCPSCPNQKSKLAKRCRACKIKEAHTKVSDEIFQLEGEPCRLIPLTQGLATIVDAHNFTFLSQYSWRSQRTAQGNVYAMRTTKDMRRVLMHQDIKKRDKRGRMDHRNRHTLDNRESNLRPCTVSQNAANMKKKIRSKSGYKGVWLNKRRKIWEAKIMVNYENKYLGKYKTPEEAAKAYDEAALKYFGEFACLNFPLQLSNHPIRLVSSP